MKALVKTKIAVPLIIFGITIVGQLFHLFVIQSDSLGTRLPLFVSYSLISGIGGYFLIDLITARGLIRRKILFIKLLALYFGILIVVNNYLTLSFNIGMLTPSVQLLLTVLILAVVVFLDIFPKPGRDFEFIPEIRQLPQKYLRSHPFRTILETVFRLFPFPEPIALYKVGNPNSNSPVLVTGNYELTVRRVAKAIRGLDCWLLVCDSRGINIWCSSLSGHFSEKDIICAIGLTELSKHVSRREIIVPQLCASGVNIIVIRKETGFRPVFGPVYIEYIRDFLNNKNKEDSKLRKVKFGFWERIEMAVGSPINLTAVLVLVFLFISLSKLLFIVPVLYLTAVVQAIIYPYRPVKRIQSWSVIYSLIITVIVTAAEIMLKAFSLSWLIGIAVTLGIGIFYLVNEFEGWSPLVKYNLKSIYNDTNFPEISVNENRCIGCGLCYQVCPKSVFLTENGKAKVFDRKECVRCEACYKQCPTNAIDHSCDKREKEQCSCAFCTMQNSLKIDDH